MKFEEIKPGTMLSPVPAVLVTCADENGKPNALTIAWTGTVCSDPPMVSISVRKERFSHALIENSGEFVINLCGEELLRALDYCGVRSGKDTDKISDCGLKCVKASGMLRAQAIENAPVYLGCKVKQIIPLGSHDLFLSDIVSVGVREDLIDEKGQIDLKNAHLTTYAHGVYYGLGSALGFFGYSVAAQDKLEKRMKALR